MGSPTSTAERSRPGVTRETATPVDVAEKRSAEEDDFREETGDKEDCGNDRTLALPRTTRKRLKEKRIQRVLADNIFFQRKKKKKLKLESHRLKKSAGLFSGVALCAEGQLGRSSR